MYCTIVFLAVFSNLQMFGHIDYAYDRELNKQEGSWGMNRYILMLILGVCVGAIFVLGYLVGLGQTWMFIPLFYLVLLLFLPRPCLQKKSIRIVLDLAMLLPMLRWLW